jgi:ferredoxin
MRVIVDTQKCIASGNCVLSAPDVFDQSEEDGIVILLSEHPTPEQADAARQAARVCPSMAILVEE